MEVHPYVLIPVIVAAVLIYPIARYFFIRYVRRIESIHHLPRNYKGHKLSGHVKRVSDGDGFYFVHMPIFSCSPKEHAQALKVRLAGIDAPEVRSFNYKAQPLSGEARDKLTSLISNKTVIIKILDIDFYGRIVCMVYARKAFFHLENVNLSMLHSGLACVYDGNDASYGDIYDQLILAENKAKEAKLGIWGVKGFELPMDYKKRNRLTKLRKGKAA
ncbi:hypothetical protein ENBRE01_2622 [Enteropsectra breve]|nr:hypothetical protein ENBRE01_2622 [Enteropsectra breve]